MNQDMLIVLPKLYIMEEEVSVPTVRVMCLCSMSNRCLAHRRRARAANLNLKELLARTSLVGLTSTARLLFTIQALRLPF